MITNYIKEYVNIDSSLFSSRFRTIPITTEFCFTIDNIQYDLTLNVFSSCLELLTEPKIYMDIVNWEYNTNKHTLSLLTSKSKVIFHYFKDNRVYTVETPKELFLNIIHKYKHNTT